MHINAKVGIWNLAVVVWISLWVIIIRLMPELICEQLDTYFGEMFFDIDKGNYYTQFATGKKIEFRREKATGDLIWKSQFHYNKKL